MKKTRFSLTSILTIAYLLLSISIHAQNKKDVYDKIDRALFYPQGQELYGSQAYKNKAYTFGFAICVNKTGEIDTILVTNTTKALDSIVSFARLTKVLKADRKFFLNYKNSVFVGTVLVRRSWDNHVDNILDTYQKSLTPEISDFDSYFFNMMPDIGAFSKSRQIIILPAFKLIVSKAQP